MKPIGSKNFFSNLLARTFLDPIARTGAGLSQVAGKVNSRIFNDPSYSKNVSRYEGILGSKVASEVEKNPLTQGVGKGFAGAASAGLGAGMAPLKAATLGGRLGLSAVKGALPSALSALGGSQKGEELPATVAGGALGALLGLGGQAVGEVGKALRPKIESTVFKGVDVKSVLGSNKKSVVRNSNALKNAQDTIIRKYRDLSGEDVVTSNELVNRLDEVVGSVKNEGDSVLASTTLKGFKDKLGKKVASLPVSTFEKLEKLDTFQEALNIYRKLPSNPTALQVKEFNDAIVAASGGLKQVQGQGLGTSNVKNALKGISDFIRLDAFKKNPALDRALNTTSGTIDVANVLRKKFEEGIKPGFDFGAVKAKAPVDLRNFLEKLATSGNKDMSASLQTLLPMLTGTAVSAPAPQGGMEGQMVSPNITGNEGLGVTGEDFGLAQEWESSLAGLPEFGMAEAPQVNPQQQFLQALATASQILPGASISQQLGLAEMLYGLGQEGQAQGQEQGLATVGQVSQGVVPADKITDNDKDYLQAYTNLTDARDFLIQNGGSGKLATVAGNVGAFFGSTSDASQFKAKLNSSIASVRKALIGAGQTESELKNLDFPKVTDEPQVALQKLDELIRQIENRPVGAVGQ